MSTNRIVRLTKKLIATFVILAAITVITTSAAVSWLVGNFLN